MDENIYCWPIISTGDKVKWKLFMAKNSDLSLVSFVCELLASEHEYHYRLK